MVWCSCMTRAETTGRQRISATNDDDNAAKDVKTLEKKKKKQDLGPRLIDAEMD